jgi:lipopolysaccharide transport system permease protein
LLVGLIVLGVIFPIVGVSLSWMALQGFVILFLLLLMTTGCALLLSCANLFYRDVKYILQLVLNFGVFATPVFFEPQMLGRKGAAIMLAIPLSPLIQGLDLAVTQGHNLFKPLAVATAKGPVQVWAPWMLAYATAISLAFLGVGLIVFRRASSRFAEMA